MTEVGKESGESENMRTRARDDGHTEGRCRGGTENQRKNVLEVHRGENEAAGVGCDDVEYRRTLREMENPSEQNG